MQPKDAKENVERFKIRGADVNEFEYDRNHEARAAGNKDVASPARRAIAKQSYPTKLGKKK